MGWQFVHNGRWIVRRGAAGARTLRHSRAVHRRPALALANGTANSKKSRGTRATEYTTEEFHAYFEGQFGSRWPALYTAMARPTRHVALFNPFVTGEGRAPPEEQLPRSTPLPPQLGLSRLPKALQYPPAAEGGGRYPPPSSFPSTFASSSPLSAWYWLDLASLLPPLALGVAPGQAVLDMCAAPGGKSLVLAQLLFAAAEGYVGKEASGSQSSDYYLGGQQQQLQQQQQQQQQAGLGAQGGSTSLVCNELDAGRRRRLMQVLREYVPEPVRQWVRVTPHNGAAYWRLHEAEAYDRVLLDAPCSSDRHIVQQAQARSGAADSGGCGSGGSRDGRRSVGEGWGKILKADWSVKRCAAIAGEQAKLLAAAVKALKPGGRLVYSTCSIAAVENDEVVERVLQKAGPALVVASHCMLGAHARLAAVGGTVPGIGGSSGEEEAGAGAPAAAEPVAEATAARASIASRSSRSGGGGGGVAAGGPPVGVDFEAWGAERTQHGWLLLPECTGWGPMYVCVLEKVGSCGDLKRVKVNKYARGAEGGGGRDAGE